MQKSLQYFFLMVFPNPEACHIAPVSHLRNWKFSKLLPVCTSRHPIKLSNFNFLGYHYITYQDGAILLFTVDRLHMCRHVTDKHVLSCWDTMLIIMSRVVNFFASCNTIAALFCLLHDEILNCKADYWNKEKYLFPSIYNHITTQSCRINSFWQKNIWGEHEWRILSFTFTLYHYVQHE